MNLGSNYTHRVTLRLNDEQYDFLVRVSDLLGVSPSDYMRMSINTGMVAMKNSVGALPGGDIATDTLKGLVGTNENVKTDINDQL